ncbi:hypothetical protein WOLCODRAFT_152037 [Wolfiporia cocos MD-104 SS10]|uniref:Uncharacterized protein n=1 Tax=Wolfiporia cocos (strain MD-104) TaxID=742152 RepID=A0A2H3K0M8_WOLCO|nr:hypothetical protein WOLCODRAFT_152037 [Wolfiporia cocos MD-104 SS10]
MSAPAGDYFPSPVGGAPFPHDLVPSILFAVLYGLLAPLVIYRMTSKRTRNVMLIAAAVFALERIADFSIRAAEATIPRDRTSTGIVTYMQTTYSMGFVSIGQCLLVLLRCLLVNSASPSTGATYKTIVEEHDYESRNPLTARMDNASTDERFSSASTLTITEVVPEVEKRRQSYRRACIAASMVYYAVIALGSIAGSLYFKAISSPSTAKLVQHMRYASTAISLCLLFGTAGVSMYILYTKPSHSRPALFIITNSLLITIPAIYRLIVMRFQTDSIVSTAPGSLNSPGSKATFYIFHIVPELVVTAHLFSVDVRELFQVGPLGQPQPRSK